ncbi:hypothetical protein LVO85_10975 [Ornithinimicrobium sp. EGI L100131]|nr:hypothetical protein [Ornithinimicrobium sediminis]MCE0487367.1 hypothetical protein [Ornithinimicrobium sediminis]
MPQTLADDGEVYVRSQQERSGTVPEVVEAHWPQPALNSQLCEHLGEPIGGKRHPIAATEDQVVIAVGSPEGVSVLGLSVLLAEKCID